MQTKLLKRSDLTTILESNLRMANCQQWPELSDETFRLMENVIGGDVFIWNELSESGEVVSARTYPALSNRFWIDIIPALTHYLYEHPFVTKLMDEKPESLIASISDSISTRKFSETNLYQTAYNEFDGKYQMSSALKTGYGTYLILSVNRAKRDFNQREKCILGIINQHVLNYHTSLLRLDELNSKLYEITKTSETATSSHLYLDDRFIIVGNSSSANEFINDRFGKGSHSIRLPQLLIDQIQTLDTGSHPIKRKQFKHQESDFEIELKSIDTRISKLVVAQNKKAETPINQKAKLLTLTYRERESVQLAITGLSNQEIGQKMNLSARTIEKYLHSSYEKLNIKNRTQLTQKLMSAV